MFPIKNNQHQNLAFGGMAMILMGLPLSVFMVSVGTFVLAGNWLLEGNYRKRLSQFFKNPLSLILISIFVMHCVGMAYTENLSHGLKELKVKLPILLMPLFLFTSKLPSKKRQQDLLMLFVLACIIGTIFGMGRYFEITGGEVINKRHISVFISHIRFSLMLTLSSFILAYFLFSKWQEWSIAEKIICFSAMVWIIVFLIILETFTGYLAFATVLLYSMLRLLIKQQNKLLKLGVFSTMLLLMLAGFFYVKNISDKHFQNFPFDYKTLTVKTVNGNYYAHQKDILYRENGHRVWNFVCWRELKNEWPKRSSIHFDSNDKKGQPIAFTALRYMASKGLTKDSLGFNQLTQQDIENIELGFTNYLYTDKFGVSRRIDQILWALEEYSWNQNANNSSSIQRWVYLKVGWSIFKENFLFGVGTGDVISEYKKHYAANNQGLEKKFQGISHNQFLTIAIALGLFGFLGFIFALAYPLFLYKRDYLYVAFIVLMMVSFLTDNTLGTQSGVTLFAFFNAFLIVRREFEEVEG